MNTTIQKTTIQKEFKFYEKIINENGESNLRLIHTENLEEACNVIKKHKTLILKVMQTLNLVLQNYENYDSENISNFIDKIIAQSEKSKTIHVICEI